MNNQVKKILLIILSAILVAELIFVGFMALNRKEPEVTEAPTETESAETTLPTEEPTEEPTGEPTEAPTEEPAEEPTEEPAEVSSNRYVLTFAGDCTLGSTSDKWNSASSFVKTIGENYSYPFANVLEYFENDDFTIINLEGVLADSGTAASKRFAFRGPVAYTEIMTGSSVEAVTLANNHTADYGSKGYQSTTEALTAANITFVEENKTALYTTESGLVIGLYADAFSFTKGDISANIGALKKAGAEIIICAFHWGTEGSYRATSAQQSYAHAAIDAGADIVYGHHPHVLQKIEEYGDGIIYYSLGNFSFGGSVFPQDYDSAVLQQEIIREDDDSLHLGELTIIPVSISSKNGQNNFQPTPMEKDSKAYERVMSKLNGTFTGPDLNVDYSKLDDPTEPPATEAPSTGGESGGESSGESGGSSSGDTGTSGGESAGGNDAGSSSGDAGSSSGGSSDAGSSSGDSGSAGGDAGSSGSSGGDAGSASGGDAGSGSAGGDAGAPAPAPAPDSGSAEG